jgi:hypothetical protein
MSTDERSADEVWRAEGLRVFNGAWWTIDLAIAWVMTGDVDAAIIGAHSPRSGSAGAVLAAKAALRTEEFTDSNRLNRVEARLAGDGYAWACERVVETLRDARWSARGRQSAGEPVRPIPSRFWTTAEITRRSRVGLVALTAKTEWRDIEVPSAAFRSWKGKRGRPAKGSTKRPVDPVDRITRDLRVKELEQAAPERSTIEQLAYGVGEETGIDVDTSRIARTVRATDRASRRRGKPVPPRNRNEVT